MPNYNVDVWAGMKEGTQTLRQAWKDVLDAKREEEVTRQLGLSSQLKQMELSDALRKQNFDEQNRQAFLAAENTAPRTEYVPTGQPQ